MKILITGGCGFVGSNIAIFLKRMYPGYTIAVFDNLRRRGSESNLKIFKHLGIEFIHGDIRHKEDLEFLKFDVMIEASAEPSVLAGLDGQRRYLIDTNLNGLVNALEVALMQKAKVIFISTSRVFPMEIINNLPYEETNLRYQLPSNFTVAGVVNGGFTEEFPLQGSRTLYGATKLSCELIIQEYINSFGLDVIINRCGVIAGPGQFGKVDQGFLTLWVANYFYKKDLTIFGNGKQVRDILNIFDLVGLIDKQIHTFREFSNHVFNVGGGLGNSISLLELDSLCQEIICYKEIVHHASRQLDLKYYVSNSDKIALKGWVPTTTVRQTLAQIFEWFIQNDKEVKWIFA